MAKTDNLTDFLVDLADGIRAKKGITGDINPQDFRAEIESIEGGGSAEGNWEYWDTLGTPCSEISFFFRAVACLAKFEYSNGACIMPAWQVSQASASDKCYMVAINLDLPYIVPTAPNIKTVGDVLNQEEEGMGTIRDILVMYGFKQVTKEEFYKLD